MNHLGPRAITAVAAVQPYWFYSLGCSSYVACLSVGGRYWHRYGFLVHSPKTEHHYGKAQRLVPIFAKLRPYLLKAYQEREPGSEYVIAKHRLESLNLRQQFERIIERAGLKLWPRLFQNLRASRETELMDEFSLKTVCGWIGNSPAVAAKHYMMTIDLNNDIQRALNWEEDAVQTQQKTQQTSEGEKSPKQTEDEQKPQYQGENKDFVSSGPVTSR